MDLFLAYCYQDEEFANGLEDDLAGRGIVVGEPLPLWPGQRLLPQIDQRLHESLHAIVVVSRAFLQFSWPRKELDVVTTRSKVVAILSDIIEEDVVGHSPGLAVAALPGSLSGRLVRLIHPEDEVDWN
jgi:TIR domain